ncbi:MAG: hypothetical protein RQ729_12805 [Wenzhouxiangellaceae bacterium]|nr:hypothetical protein [Wenzhouxiangellaceae bacterium]
MTARTPRSTTLVRSLTLTALAGLIGCAQLPTADRPAPDPAPLPGEVAPMRGIAFSVSGEPKNAEECFVRYEVAYPEAIAPVELALELETEMKQENSGWLGIGWMEGIREPLPSPDAVGRTGGGGLMHYIHMEELLLTCDQMRFRVIVHGCEPGPCPAMSIDDEASSFGVLLDDRSPR